MTKPATAQAAMAVTAAFLFLAAPAKAVLLSGFESGFAADGWSTIGSTAIVDGTFGSGPTQGTFQAFLSTGSGAASASSLETFLGISPGDIDTVSPSGAPSRNRQAWPCLPPASPASARCGAGPDKPVR